MPELLEKISSRFKSCQKMNTTTFIKSLHNMFLQHYNKHLRDRNEFNAEISSKLFPQLLKCLYTKKFLQGKFLKNLIDKKIFKIENIEESSKVTIDCESLSTIYERSNSNQKFDATKIEDKAEILLKMTQMLLSDLSHFSTGLPKTKSALLNKTKSILRMYVNSKEIHIEHKMFLDDSGNKAIMWVLDLLQANNIIK